ncbi:type II secretion system protein, partial [mine drainage metagenome]
MPSFRYEALNADGVVMNGILNADDERAAMRALERNGLTPLKVAEHAATRGALAAWRQRKPTVPELSVPLYELCTMLKAGVPLVDAVAAQGQSSHHPQVTAAFAGMAQALRRGRSFADALGSSGLQLPPYIQQLVRAGELTGRMGEALSGGVAQMEYEHRLHSEMRNALIYPTILVLAGIGAVLVMFAFVVPKFSMLLH